MSTIRDKYLYIRANRKKFLFDTEIKTKIYEYYSKNNQSVYYDNPILLNGNKPLEEFDNKGRSDEIALLLWNSIFSDYPKITSIKQIKESSTSILKDLNKSYPNGNNMSESDKIRFITAFSYTSFYGIQKPNKSLYSYNSMVKTLESHANPRIVNKPWLITNLKYLKTYIAFHTDLMNKDFGEICMNAKMSSASIKGVSSYRDYVLEHDLDSIVYHLQRNVEFEIYAGTRIDRRGKYRLICSFNGAFRVVDYLINNGSYDLCSHGSILSKYTTEGYNDAMLWKSMKVMARRNEYTMICLDYKGYDTQISMLEYLQISSMLNAHRLNSKWFSTMFGEYSRWLMQPKPLVVRGDHPKIILELYKTLASGLHGTHSFENLIGIATMMQAKKLGMQIDRFWTNGDDQNILIHNNDVERYMQFIGRYYNISWEKSLVGHRMAVWGKMWFDEDFYPMYEIGTFRSIWEKEGGDVNIVESSKFESNYCKVLRVAITMIRLGKPEKEVEHWINILCNESNPIIDPTRIPLKLNNLKVYKTRSLKRERHPKGLESAKKYLMSKHFDLNVLGVRNYFDMLLSMYVSRSIFDLNVDDVAYHPRGMAMYIYSGVNYGDNKSKNIPYMLSDLYKADGDTLEFLFVKNVLQGTKSYDGGVPKDYKFFDMLTLAKAINERNKFAWSYLVR